MNVQQDTSVELLKTRQMLMTITEREDERGTNKSAVLQECCLCANYSLYFYVTFCISSFSAYFL